ncbi:PilZ domain-containing protein [Thalassotalea sp. G20_0]|uniref:PilZ domain-containing protein n=1 Tax=Thalassotalea sp. G20_0 TaxID=2821093 RepID=UPI001ADC3B44|nr:PilZ domain-containing protein [Thalassotalea sp. G20_0]MBO9494549.1 PilZ domain-containing protein [Thalassotalea sp. G20_0]
MGKGMQGLMSLTIRDTASLYEAYMPFISGGGLFVPTHKHYNLGDDVFIRLTLMDEPEKIPVPGKVVWVTPMGAQGGRQAGIGVQFNDPTDSVRSKIEKHIAGALSSDRHTNTM